MEKEQKMSFVDHVKDYASVRSTVELVGTGIAFAGMISCLGAAAGANLFGIGTGTLAPVLTAAAGTFAVGVGITVSGAVVAWKGHQAMRQSARLLAQGKFQESDQAAVRGQRLAAANSPEYRTQGNTYRAIVGAALLVSVGMQAMAGQATAAVHDTQNTLGKVIQEGNLDPTALSQERIFELTNGVQQTGVQFKRDSLSQHLVVDYAERQMNKALQEVDGVVQNGTHEQLHDLSERYGTDDPQQMREIIQDHYQSEIDQFQDDRAGLGNSEDFTTSHDGTLSAKEAYMQYLQHQMFDEMKVLDSLIDAEDSMSESDYNQGMDRLYNTYGTTDSKDIRNQLLEIYQERYQEVQEMDLSQVPNVETEKWSAGLDLSKDPLLGGQDESTFSQKVASGTGDLCVDTKNDIFRNDKTKLSLKWNSKPKAPSGLSYQEKRQWYKDNASDVNTDVRINGRGQSICSKGLRGASDVVPEIMKFGGWLFSDASQSNDKPGFSVDRSAGFKNSNSEFQDQSTGLQATVFPDKTPDPTVSKAKTQVHSSSHGRA